MAVTLTPLQEKLLIIALNTTVVIVTLVNLICFCAVEYTITRRGWALVIRKRHPRIGFGDTGNRERNMEEGRAKEWFLGRKTKSMRERKKIRSQRERLRAPQGALLSERWPGQQATANSPSRNIPISLDQSGRKHYPRSPYPSPLPPEITISTNPSSSESLQTPRPSPSHERDHSNVSSISMLPPPLYSSPLPTPMSQHLRAPEMAHLKTLQPLWHHDIPLRVPALAAATKFNNSNSLQSTTLKSNSSAKSMSSLSASSSRIALLESPLPIWRSEHNGLGEHDRKDDTKNADEMGQNIVYRARIRVVRGMLTEGRYRWYGDEGRFKRISWVLPHETK